MNVTYGHGSTAQVEFDLTMRRGLHDLDECFAREPAFEAAEFVGSNDDDFLATVDRDVLRSLAVDFPDQLAEAGFGILQEPVAGTRLWRQAGFALSCRSFPGF